MVCFQCSVLPFWILSVHHFTHLLSKQIVLQRTNILKYILIIYNLIVLNSGLQVLIVKEKRFIEDLLKHTCLFFYKHTFGVESNEIEYADLFEQQILIDFIFICSPNQTFKRTSSF